MIVAEAADLTVLSVGSSNDETRGPPTKLVRR
jgi:hypothetical protein